MRATTNFDGILHLRRDALNFGVLARFDDHADLDRAIHGQPGALWRLKFTRHPDHAVPPLPGAVPLLVSYMPTAEAWQVATARMAGTGFASVSAGNPCRDARGRTYVDLDRWRVVIRTRIG